MLMPEGEVPEDGELRLGGVVLSGRRAYAGERRSRLVAWVRFSRSPSGSRAWPRRRAST